MGLSLVGDDYWYLRHMKCQRFVFSCGDYCDEYRVKGFEMLLRFILDHASIQHLDYKHRKIVLHEDSYNHEVAWFVKEVRDWLYDSDVVGESSSGEIRNYLGYDFLYSPRLTKFLEWLEDNFKRYYGNEFMLTYTEVYPEGMEVKE